jgi:predicted acetyltransferase
MGRAQVLVQVQVRRALSQDQVPISRMLELYQHDLSGIWDQDLDAEGTYGYPLARYWSREDHHAFVATVDGRYAAFALVDAAVRVSGTGHWMDQFFVLKKYRRSGVGRTLAHAVFDALPGRWEVAQMLCNVRAQSFWRRVIADYTGGDYSEHQLDDDSWCGPVQCFRSGQADARGVETGDAVQRPAASSEPDDHRGSV